MPSAEARRSPRVLVTGATGMLGHKMLQVLSGRLDDVWGVMRSLRESAPYRNIPLFQGSRVLDGIDLADSDAAMEVVRELRPDVIVNCVGVVKHRDEAKQATVSIAVNALLPHVLAAECSAGGGRLIHISTDCVFSGDRGGYSEDDTPDARDLYGRSKALGEVTGPNALTLRTSIIGRELAHRASLLEWLMAQRGRTIHGYTGAWWSGVTTNHLASLVFRIITEHPGLAGLHQVSSGRISKYELLVRLAAAYRLDVQIQPDDDFYCDRSLRGDRLRAAIGYVCPDYDELIHEMANDATPYQQWLGASDSD